MTRVCTICRHAERGAIDQALIASEPYRHIATRFSVSTGALMRHKADCLPAVLVKAEQAKEVSRADDLYEQVKQLRNRAIRILLTAEQAGDLRTALHGIREARACIELLLEVEGKIDRAPVVNLLLTPEWIETRAIITDALRPYPEASYAMAAALMKVSRDRTS